MTVFHGDCLEGSAIRKVITTRSKTYIEKTISAPNKEDLNKKLGLEEKEGWEILRENEKSYRLKFDKPLDEQLEDELWCLTAQMGFMELSDGRLFKISVGEGLEPRQIDVFAKDDECALFIECTQSATPKKKDMSNLIQKISAINGDVRKSVITQYGTAEPLKMRWVIATRRIEWGSADLNKAREAQIIVLRDQEIDYFKKLTSHIKGAARYQLLAHVFAGEGIKGLENKVLATKGNMGGQEFYNFLMSPSKLLKLAYISHKASREVDSIETYQRMLKPARLKDIAEYIDNGGQFPTNIVINIKTKRQKALQFDKKMDVGNATVGTLILPASYCCAWVIDGQHRLYGYAHSKRSEVADDKTVFPVLAYVNLPPKDEAKMFVDINCEQVRVQKNLLMEIYATLNWGSDSREEQLEAIWSRLALALDRSPSSPLYNRVITSANQKHGTRCLTTTSFSDGLRENKFFGEVTRSGDFYPGPLWASYANESDVLDDTLEKSKDVLSGFLGFFAKNAPNHWELGDAPGGFLATNLGLRATFRVLKHIISFCEKQNGLQLHSQDAETIVDLVCKYCQPIADLFEGATAETVASFRGNSSQAGVAINAMGLMFYIKEQHPDFYADGLQEYIDSRDVEGTHDAQRLVTDIQKRINEVVIGKLKERFGEKGRAWWYEGVSEKIRTNCVGMHEQNKGEGKPENYLFLIDYQTIVGSPGNWSDIFQQLFSYPKTKNMKSKNKVEQLKWMKDLNDIRKKTMHPERGLLTVDQVAFIRELDKYTKEHFVVDDRGENPDTLIG